MPLHRTGNCRAIAFDLDGVILNSRNVMKRAFEESYRRAGLKGEAPFSRFLEHMGRPLESILLRMGLPTDMAASYHEVSREVTDLAAPYDGVSDLLASVHTQGLAIGLITGKDRSRTLELLDRFDLRRWFDDIVCGDDPFEPKPDPRGLWSMLERLRTPPAGAAMIGDSPIDVECALAAGVHAFGAGWGFSSAEKLVECGADRTFASPAHFAAWVEENSFCEESVGGAHLHERAIQQWIG